MPEREGVSQQGLRVPDNPSRRRFLKNVGGAAMFVGLAGAFVGVLPVISERDGIMKVAKGKADYLLPPPDESRLAEAREQVVSFRKSMEEEISQGKYGDEVRDALELVDREDSQRPVLIRQLEKEGGLEGAALRDAVKYSVGMVVAVTGLAVAVRNN